MSVVLASPSSSYSTLFFKNLKCVFSDFTLCPLFNYDLPPTFYYFDCNSQYEMTTEFSFKKQVKAIYMYIISNH